jgi:hypothetical protein
VAAARTLLAFSIHAARSHTTGETMSDDNNDNGTTGTTAETSDQLAAKRAENEAKARTAALPTDPADSTYELQPDGSTLVTLPNGTKQRRAPAGTKFLSKQEIVSADDSGYEDVPVPEWGGWVRVKKLTAAERGQIEAAQVKVDKEGESHFDGSKLRELFAQAAIVDPNTGVRLFSAKELHLLSAKSAAAMDRVYEAATRQARVS